MLNTINLDDEPLSKTREVYDIVLDRNLAAEMKALSPKLTKLPPQPRLSDRWVLPELSSDLVSHRFNSFTPPLALPIKGRGIVDASSILTRKAARERRHIQHRKAVVAQPAQIP